MNFMKIIREFFLAVFPLISLPLIMLLQVKLGYEVALFPLYMIAIAALTWRFGAVGGTLTAILAAVLWYWGIEITNTTFTYKWAVYYNAAARFALFIMMVFFLTMFRRIRDRQERLMESMRGLLHVCNCCGALQGSDGEWVPLGEIPERKAQEARMCPACSRTVRG